jgi:hypothetical protein
VESMCIGEVRARQMLSGADVSALVAAMGIGGRCPDYLSPPPETLHATAPCLAPRSPHTLRLLNRLTTFRPESLPQPHPPSTYYRHCYRD